MPVEKVLLLDIDGVLNDHRRWSNGYCGIDPDKMRNLNRIVAATECKIVLASAWRYIILGGDMTLKGFGHLLAIHGASKLVVGAVHDHLPADTDVNDPFDRGKLAAAWLVANQWVDRAVALDDGDKDGKDLGYEHMKIPVVRPKPSRGMTWEDANRVIALFDHDMGRPWAATRVASQAA